MAVLALAALVAPASASATPCPNAGAMPGAASPAALRTATLCLMNAERAAHGLAPLGAQPELARAAAGYARAMVHGRFFDHTSPGGSTMLERIRATSYLRHVGAWSVGENLAWGSGRMATPRATVNAWMRSAGHRANLLDAHFTDVGIGIARGAPVRLRRGERGGTYVTDFGRRGHR